MNPKQIGHSGRRCGKFCQRRGPRPSVSESGICALLHPDRIPRLWCERILEVSAAEPSSAGLSPAVGPFSRRHLGGPVPGGRQGASGGRRGRVRGRADWGGPLARPVSGAAALVSSVHSGDPETYERAWRPRRHRALTQMLLWARHQAALAPYNVPAAARLPPLFSGLVNQPLLSYEALLQSQKALAGPAGLRGVHESGGPCGSY